MRTTEIRIDEHGDEMHESWLLVRANHYSSNGTRLFDSEIAHQRFVAVTITRCTRRRDLNRDWLHGTEVLVEFWLSQAQWGAFVSSFGNGSGVPATLTFLHDQGQVAQAPAESRFDQSHEDVRTSGTKALEDIERSYGRVMEAFENGGKRALREELRSLRFAIENAPANMEFAAKSLTEHVENVVTKARVDIEAMALAATEQRELTDSAAVPQLER